MENTKRYPKNHFLGLAIAICLPIGMPVGIILGHIALGPAIGALFGVVLGLAFEKMVNKNPLELTEAQKRSARKMLLLFIGTGIGTFLIVTLIYLKNLN